MTITSIYQLTHSPTFFSADSGINLKNNQHNTQDTEQNGTPRLTLHTNRLMQHYYRLRDDRNNTTALLHFLKTFPHMLQHYLKDNIFSEQEKLSLLSRLPEKQLMALTKKIDKTFNHGMENILALVNKALVNSTNKAFFPSPLKYKPQ